MASEGINLHYQCHRMIHFDIPWSLMVFRQRNGRIDRYGQKEKPLILYLFTESNNDKLKGDLRVLQLLVTKDEQATKNIGDPSALLGVYDIDAEESITASVIQGDLEAAAFEDRLNADPTGMDLFDIFLDQPARPTVTPNSLPSLFRSEADYVRAALEEPPGPVATRTQGRCAFKVADRPARPCDQPARSTPPTASSKLSEDQASMQSQIHHA
ncbi:MAG: hypothetical protein R3E66_24440 [bacterium]